MSYVDNSVEIGDFFSDYVKNEEKNQELYTFSILQVNFIKSCKNTE